MLSNYTTPADVRGALGVSDEELEDSEFDLQLHEDTLEAELDEVGDGLHAFYMSLVPEPVLTGTQERFMRYARLFATYAVARALTASMPMFSPKAIEDGKARMERFNDPHRETIKAVNTAYERWRKKLQEAYLALGQEGRVRTPRPYFSAVTPGSDPITNG